MGRGVIEEGNATDPKPLHMASFEHTVPLTGTSALIPVTRGRNAERVSGVMDQRAFCKESDQTTLAWMKRASKKS